MPKILLVDDSRENLILFENLLYRFDVDIYKALSGMDANKLCRTHDFALIILDVQMPDLDGFQTLELIRINPQCKEIPVIFVSAYFNDEIHIIKGIETGAVDFLVKPLISEIFEGKVSVFLDLYNQKNILKESLQTQKQLNQQLEEANSELNQYKNHLENLVDERTKRLQDSEEKYRFISEHSEDIIFVFLSTGKLVYLSPSVKRLLNYEIKPNQELTVFDFINSFIPSESMYLNHKFIERYEKTEVSFVETYPFTTKYGRTMYLEIISRSVSKDDEGVVKILAVGRNITARYNAEQKLSTYTEKLRQQKNDLNIVNTELEKASRLKDEFLASMSHELRTPLNAILGYAKLLMRNNKVSEELKQSIEIINKSGNHLLIIINDILNLAKIEAGKTEINKTFFSLRYFLDTIVDSTKIRAQQKKLEFVLKNDIDDVIWVRTDENKLRQILFNLLSNAVKFTDEGTVCLHVHNTGNNFSFEVIDTGIGIEQKNLEDIFNPFTQVGDRRFYTEGTGLGLSISSKLTQMIGGRLYVKSKNGKGSVFGVNIDLQISEVSVNNKNKIHQKLVAYTGATKTTCIVDDDVKTRDILKQYLGNIGFDIIEAENGKEVINVLKHQVPDLLLIDLHMPVLNGFDAFKIIKKDKRFDAMKIIAISANISNRGKCMDCGFDAFISKPIDFRKLSNKIKKLLNVVWEFENDNNSPDSTDVKAEKISASDIEKLKNLTKHGKIKNMILLLEEIRREQPTLKTTVKTLIELAQRFEFKQISTLLTQMEQQ